MHKYPIMYFSIGRMNFQEDQLNKLIKFEEVAGNIKNDTEIPDLRLDFNSGVRLQVPAGNWYVKILDYDSGKIGYEGAISEVTLVSAEKFYIHWHVMCYLENELVFEHIMELEEKKIFIFMANGVLGDTISLLPYVEAFRKKYNAEVYLYPPTAFKDICQMYLPNVKLTDETPDDIYATFLLAVWDNPPYMIPDSAKIFTPAMSARVILGIDRGAPKIKYYPTEVRKIKEPYVCIAVQASGTMKCWHYPNGWNIVVSRLKKMGYRVLCIDAEPFHNEGGYITKIPVGAEDFTGLLPLMERVNLLSYAEFFIGLGSGLSWLAWACDIPVVLISGFSQTISEFDTPYRVINRLVCHGCYNDLTVNWKIGCPYYRGTEREYECSKGIHPRQVLQAVNSIINDKLNKK